MSLVALYSEDAPGDRARLEARGIRAQGRIDFRRRVRVPGRDWDEAVVTLEILFDPALPRASNVLVQQHKPDLVWAPAWMSHPNGAFGPLSVLSINAKLTASASNTRSMTWAERPIVGE